LHSTTFGDHTTFWRIVRVSLIGIESLVDHAATAPAYRMRMDGSIVDIPNGDPGVAFSARRNIAPTSPRFASGFRTLPPVERGEVSILGRRSLTTTNGQWHASSGLPHACLSRVALAYVSGSNPLRLPLIEPYCEHRTPGIRTRVRYPPRGTLRPGTGAAGTAAGTCLLPNHGSVNSFG
jgi:hypothetical protein